MLFTCLYHWFNFFGFILFYFIFVTLRGLPWGGRAYLDHSLIDVACHPVPQWSTLILHGHSSSTEYNSCTSWRGEGSQAEANRHVYALSQSNMSSETDCLVSPPKDTKANPSSQFCGCTVKEKEKALSHRGPRALCPGFPISHRLYKSEANPGNILHGM